MPTVAASVGELLGLLDGIARVEGDRLVVVDEAALRGPGIRDVVWTATFSQDTDTVDPDIAALVRPAGAPPVPSAPPPKKGKRSSRSPAKKTIAQKPPKVAKAPRRRRAG